MNRHGIALRISVFNGWRNEQPKRHMASENRNNKLHAVALGHVAELGEATKHLLVHARASGGRIGKRQLVKREARLAAIAVVRPCTVDFDDGLKVTPCGENSKDSHAMGLKDCKVLFDAFWPPVAPHPRGGLACPVIDAKLEPPVLEKRLAHGIRGKCAADANRRDGQHYHVF